MEEGKRKKSKKGDATKGAKEREEQKDKVENKMKSKK